MMLYVRDELGSGETPSDAVDTEFSVAYRLRKLNPVFNDFFDVLRRFVGLVGMNAY
jgi:hypothetical protein